MKVYLLMDGRAHVDPTEATVYAVADSLEQAREDRDEAGEEGVAIVEADQVGHEYRNLRVVE